MTKKRPSLLRSCSHERSSEGLQVNYRKTTKADDLILIFSAMTTDKLQNNYRITSDPFSEPFVHPTPLPVLH